MKETETMRGYDDTQELKKMARGIMTGEYTSVEQAARAVLNEDGGSNVDRLRRKFRQDNWFVKGRDDYFVELLSGPQPRLMYGDDINSWSYLLKAWRRFMRNPIASTMRIQRSESFWERESTVAIMYIGWIIQFPTLVFLLTIFKDLTNFWTFLFAFVVSGLFSVLLFGSAQMQWEFYSELPEPGERTERSTHGSAAA